MSSTKQTKHNPDLTRRAALTKPPGALLQVTGANRTKGPSITAMLPMLIFCVLQLSFCTWLANANPAIAETDSTGFVVKQMGTVTSESGWVILQRSLSASSDDSENVESLLYWTSDNGQHWRDITPPLDDVPFLVSVFFLDESHGWIVAMDSELAEPPPHCYLFSTRDGGQNWTKAELNSNLMDSLDLAMRPTGIEFVDPEHGWISWRWSWGNSRASAMTATEDGGKTWEKLPASHGSGPMHFLSRNDGWMIGASEGQESAPIQEADALWATHDGGLSWKAFPLPLPGVSATTLTRLLDVRFKNNREGTVAAALYSPDSDPNFRYFECVTRDAGNSWRFVSFTSSNAQPLLGNDFLYWSDFQSDSSKLAFRTSAAILDPSLPVGLAPDGSFGLFRFHDNLRGWATFNDGPSAFFNIPGRGYAPVELLSTADGGHTWQIITPPEAAQAAFPRPELYSVNGAAVRFPRIVPNFALRSLEPARSYGLLPLGRSNPGDSLELKGRGFLPQNTVHIGEESILAESKSGSSIVFTVPEKLQPGHYELFVENAHGKTDPVQVVIGTPVCLQITMVQSLSIHCGCRPVIHRGQTIRIDGVGFKPGDTVKLGNHTLVPKLVTENDAFLEVEIPKSLPKGPLRMYILRETQASNVVGVEVQ